MNGMRSKLTLIMERIGPGNTEDNFRFWACRGVRSSCKKRVKKGKRCTDCMPVDDENEELGHVVKRLKRGDA